MTEYDAAPTVSMSDHDHVQGDPDAAVTVVEYGDYQCAYCAAAYPMVRQLQQQYGRDLCLVFRHFPLTRMHELALPAARLAEAAGMHGDFWSMHDWLYEHHDQWVAEGLPGLQQGVRALDMDESDIAKTIDSGKPADRVDQDMESGQRNAVHSTPSFFINGRLYDGDFSALGQQIEAALAGR